MNFGGLPRRSTFLKSLREDTTEEAKTLVNRREFLLLDTGDIFSRTQKYPLIAAGLIAESMNVMGYDALGLGELDLFFGSKVIDALTGTADFPLVSANLLGANPFWKSYIIKEIAGIKIAVTSVVSHRFISDRFFVQARPAAEALEELIPQLKAKAHICIVLSHLGYEGTLSLVDRVPGIDVAIVAHGFKKLPPQKIAETIVTAASYQGEFVGILDLNWNRRMQKIESFSGELVHLKKHFEDDQQINDIIQKHALKVQEQLRQKNEQQEKQKQLIDNAMSMKPQEFTEFIKKMQENQNTTEVK